MKSKAETEIKLRNQILTYYLHKLGVNIKLNEVTLLNCCQLYY